MPGMPCLEVLHDERTMGVGSVILDLVDDAYQVGCAVELSDVSSPDCLHMLR
jgi:hypothetical protein